MTSQELINEAAKHAPIVKICTDNPGAIKYVEQYAKRNTIIEILKMLGNKIIPTLLEILEKILIKKYVK